MVNLQLTVILKVWKTYNLTVPISIPENGFIYPIFHIYLCQVRKNDQIEISLKNFMKDKMK